MTKNSTFKDVTIYTDGACKGNPGPGGYGAVLLYGDHRKELSAGYRFTTNNRMELLAAIKGLSALKSRCKVNLYSDSRYLVDSMTKGWVRRWKANNWMRNKNEVAQNHDLWEDLLNLCAKHIVKLIWVPGHKGNIENERCDILAVDASMRSQLLVDHNFENQNDTPSLFSPSE